MLSAILSGRPGKGPETLGRAVRPRSRRSFMPHLELLEDRTLLSTGLNPHPLPEGASTLSWLGRALPAWDDQWVVELRGAQQLAAVQDRLNALGDGFRALQWLGAD